MRDLPMPPWPTRATTWPFSAAGARPPVEQNGDFLMSPDERRLGSTTRLQARYLALADHLVDRHRPHEALELVPAEIAILEPFGRELPRDLGHDDRVGLGHALQAGGEVGRLADDRIVVRHALGVGDAHHDQAGRDADPHPDRPDRRTVRAQLGDGAHQLEPGMDGSLGIVLVRHGIAEVDQDAIAHIARDVAVVALDRPGAAF